MAFYHRNSERKRMAHDYRRQEEEVVGSLCRLGSRPVSPKSLLEQEKRIRREIANSNERRRMQSINAGFQCLRALLPHRDGEKLSKAAILQSTADYVYQLEQEKTRLLEQNSQLMRRFPNLPHINHDSDGSCSDSPISKRKKREPDFVDEGIGSYSPSRSENGAEEVKREMIDLKIQLQHEKTLRLILEEQVRNLEARLYSSRSDSSEPMHFQYHSGTEENIKSSINLGHESGLGSPQSQVSSQDLESAHEISLRDSSPELTAVVVNTCFIVIPDDISASNTQDAMHKVSTSKQNLATIVEAIRHVEGDHLFQDDPTESKETQSFNKEKLSPTKHQYTEQIEHPVLFTNSDFSFQHQIIRSAPLTQSRPGVIVSNLS
ncbi:hypothetical protein CEXT_70801 [Caerostris extrusa]|uniref:BHLH domain-containing protein n=1 Tax=Caerostris extrusa TaxID=172846 RepID=A0AAV4YFN1_CAEEX|nr:hypothetical protein CEXT_70801 [Caerostris extrusa]